jgi:phosphatidate cytidylyltransferase
LNEKNRNLAIRAASAIVLLPVALWIVWLGPVTTAWLVAVAAALVTRELYRLTGLPLAHPAAVLGFAGAVALPFLALGLDGTGAFGKLPWAVALLSFVPILSLGAITLWPPARDLRRAAPLAAWAALGPSHVGLALASVVALRDLGDRLPGATAGVGFWWVFLLMAVTWGNDTGAYFAGRLFGKHKLYELVSPKKTWEGFWGGFVASVMLAFVVQHFALPMLRWEDALVIGAVAGVLGPLGDLAESMLKRAHDVKDSGRFMPGHGGLYDRVDALLFNAPWVFLYALFSTFIGGK